MTLNQRDKKIGSENFPDVCWGKGKQNGPAGNRNAGVERVSGKWIVFIDDDCIADEPIYDHTIGRYQ